jgi:mono/diheme cytochrome c family protein
MSKKTFIVFGIFVVALAVAIPWLVFNGKGDAKTGAQDVAAKYEDGQELFKINCGNCHTLYAAGTDGNYAPNLDELLAPNGVPTGKTASDTIKSTQGRVENAVENGVNGDTPGRMPGGILNKEQTREVAEFVANTAGEG